MRFYVIMLAGFAVHVLGAQATIAGDYILAVEAKATRQVRAVLSLGVNGHFRLVTNIDSIASHSQGSYAARSDSLFLEEAGGVRIRGRRVGQNLVIVIPHATGPIELTLQPIGAPRGAGAADGPVTPQDSAAYVTMMKSDLNNLVAAQSFYYSGRAKYTASTEELGYRVSNGVNTPQMLTNATSWSATISHPRLRSSRCAVAVGRPNPLNGSVPDGKPYCQ